MLPPLPQLTEDNWISLHFWDCTGQDQLKLADAIKKKRHGVMDSCWQRIKGIIFFCVVLAFLFKKTHLSMNPQSETLLKL